MTKHALALLLSISCMGCGAILAAAFLSDGDIDSVVENFEETIDTQQQLSKFAMEAARGELDISGYTYDPPTDQNGMTGTLTKSDAQTEFGDGNIQIRFQVEGDGVAVDPYEVDLSSMGAIDGAIEVVFVGTSPNGKPINVDADVDISTLQNSLTDVTAVVSGEWNINIDGYKTNLSTGGMEMDFDLLNDQVTRAVGSIDGDIDIPNFPIDGDFDIEGLGDKLQVAINVAVTTIDFDIDLNSIF